MSNPLTPPEEAAAAKGLHVWRPAADEVYVDIDDTNAAKRFAMASKLLGEAIASIYRRSSPSGRHNREHVRVRLKRPMSSEYERVAWQAAFGSDLQREGLSLLALIRGGAGVSVFFEKTPQSAAESSETTLDT